MKRTGVDFSMDVHGDESIPHVFLAGFEGIPEWNDAQGRHYRRYVETLERLSPDFQTRHGYPAAPPDKANLSMSTNQLANRFGCIAMTLEMPFKDNLDLPDPVEGWRSAEHTSDLQSLMRISNAVFRLQKINTLAHLSSTHKYIN